MLRYTRGISFEIYTGMGDNLQKMMNRFINLKDPESYEIAATVALPGNVVMIVFAYEPKVEPSE